MKIIPANEVYRHLPHPLLAKEGSEGRLRENALLILAGICGTVAVWGAVMLLYGAWDMLGGR